MGKKEEDSSNCSNKKKRVKNLFLFLFLFLLLPFLSKNQGVDLGLLIHFLPLPLHPLFLPF